MSNTYLSSASKYAVYASSYLFSNSSFFSTGAFSAFNVSYDKRAYEYFLNQCCMNFKRTLNQPRNVREAIFVLEANLKERYFKDMYSKSNKEIESALDNKQFRKFEILAITR